MTAWVPVVDEAELADGAVERFRTTFGGEPDGVWIAPGRVNLIGEHVDYAGGLVLPFALPYVTAVAARRRDDAVLRAASTGSDMHWGIALSAIAPGSPDGWGAYVAGVAWALGLAEGADIAVHSSVPVGSGLSSSAALECAVAVALRDLFELDADRRTLIDACIRAENEIAGASTGGMDQSIAMLAEPGHALLLDCLDFSSRQIPLDLPDAEILVIDTNAPHRLVDGQYGQRRASIEKACADLGVSTLRGLDPEAAASAMTDPVSAARVRHVTSEIVRVEKAAELLHATPDLTALGALLTASHRSLRDDYEVSSPELDSAVRASLDVGAFGARMTGGGFGGSAIALVDRTRTEAVADAVTEAASAAGLPTPTFLTATPSGAAHRQR
ncbi:galactokinase [Rhodococcus sp. BP-349]|uniref:galactokinase n=1 Tax=unclassified Rhodococcus (in: high G+C Gram-positive bacteria) TaxID=192944 RepID=UPI001C9A3EC8|nr:MULTISPECIES: galactokinase [unclassified Rhodococcus (in: high G+C Gram-positive bacteria)]MBY6537548.1 galactokinase [Rhodococcus sp. BP-363]MBY6541885.1 galactokinase [Rhodococcus sp. BP-369]MBY6561115.1 galactokinase [Rhodococcus sp. BP-370]MBY6575407.1 galactokinase [Rhodococcus sp. BP-364]MBY6584708.1 galactokinase [Rhodococcus sp. BP-358]